ncbi:hypothetical protein L3X38_019054 [Prunus dulcis]|uniref:Uncharacterized protein n=1 Tax=Prunus dulcis TaxID=3755 RepID=A0AAD4WCW4_PRUDU|nr:hypothetical protein L3X38_019054 [Prunus dulcis]
MDVATTSSTQRDDKYAAPNGNQKLAETSVGHLIVSGMDFYDKRSFCIEDFVDKAEETSLEGSPREAMVEVALSSLIQAKDLTVLKAVLGVGVGHLQRRPEDMEAGIGVLGHLQRRPENLP